jgi:predicted transcriptional regulator YdeE
MKIKKLIVIAALSFTTLIFIGVLIVFFLLIKIENKEPRIVALDKSYKVIGLSIRTSMNSVYTDIPKVLQELSSLDEKIGIPNKKQPWEYISLSNNFTDDKTWDYYTGYAVTKNESIPKGFIFFETPAGDYAVFPVRCKVKHLLGLVIGRTKRYIYTKWLPESKYEFMGYEFEYTDEKMFNENANSLDLYVAIREKKKL